MVMDALAVCLSLLAVVLGAVAIIRPGSARHAQAVRRELQPQLDSLDDRLTRFQRSIGGRVRQGTLDLLPRPEHGGSSQDGAEPGDAVHGMDAPRPLAKRDLRLAAKKQGLL